MKIFRKKFIMLMLMTLIFLVVFLTSGLLHQNRKIWEKNSFSFQNVGSSQISYKLPPGFSEQLVFQSGEDEIADLYLLSQSGIRRLTENNFPKRYPVFSPDGKKILYMAAPENKWQLYIMTLETRKIERAFKEDGNFLNPCWAPDGKTIVFETDIWGELELAKFDLQKKVIIRLTDTPGKNSLPDWSPDGSTIAFTGNRGNGWFVALLDLSTKNITKLTGLGNCRPDWSPDGNWIAFVSAKEKHTDICLMRPDGSDINNLTNDPDHSDYHPTWSSDGKRIYFSRFEEREGHWHLCVINSDSTNRFQITFGNRKHKFPDVY
ncbi:MAG: hypothetical protein ACETWK_04830 [Candidatus Aminicenantaceae bacterium]